MLRHGDKRIDAVQREKKEENQYPQLGLLNGRALREKDDHQRERSDPTYGDKVREIGHAADRVSVLERAHRNAYRIARPRRATALLEVRRLMVSACGIALAVTSFPCSVECRYQGRCNSYHLELEATKIPKPPAVANQIRSFQNHYGSPRSLFPRIGEGSAKGGPCRQTPLSTLRN